MLERFTLKPNKPTNAEKHFLRMVRKTVKKPFNKLPQKGELNCKLGVSGSKKIITILKGERIFAVIESFHPIIIPDKR
jgi:hypothetical protein